MLCLRYAAFAHSMFANNDRATRLSTLPPALRRDSAITAVHYPGLPEHPQHDRAAAQMTRFGSVVSFQMDDGDGFARLVERLNLLRCATSFGGPETSSVNRGQQPIQVLRKMRAGDGHPPWVRPHVNRPRRRR